MKSHLTMQEMKNVAKYTLIPVALAFLLSSLPAAAQDNAANLAKQLANPVAALSSVSFQLNYDTDIGPADNGDRWTLNIQPVIPISISQDWNLISRTILPVISQEDIYPGAGSQTGIGDIVQSLFFSMKAPTGGGWIWGTGPVFLFPSGTDGLLTADKWGAGPTAEMLNQRGAWTYGILANHIWSYTGENDRNDVSSTFIQPFLSYTNPDAWTFTLQTESTYDWEAEKWTIPINGVVIKIIKIGDHLISVGGGVRYWADGPASAAEAWGAVDGHFLVSEIV